MTWGGEAQRQGRAWNSPCGAALQPECMGGGNTQISGVLCEMPDAVLPGAGNEVGMGQPGARACS